MNLIKLMLSCGAACVLMLSDIDVKAQDTHHFETALVAKTNYNYGREAIYTDKLASLLFTNKLPRPSVGRAFDGVSADSNYLWKKVEADSAMRLFLRGGGGWRQRQGSYFYLTYNAEKDGPALLNIQGSLAFFLNGELHAGDPYFSGWMSIPVKLKKGLNEIYARGYAVVAKLEFPKESVALSTGDLTLPSIILGEDNSQLTGGIVVLNMTAKAIGGLQIKSELLGNSISTKVPDVPAYSLRKVPFIINARGAEEKGDLVCTVSLIQNGNLRDTATILIDAVERTGKYKSTFISAIDSSVQYYAVTPQENGSKPGEALFLSVHGAGVEAISQARAYKPKAWGTLVAPTNRRPRGFNWEDWGRIDGLEVLEIAKKRFKPADEKIYLTGHSMGGHGTWFLGATYPDKWAAIAPCAGYPTLKGYGSADGLIPDSSATEVGKVILRSGNQSDVVSLATNYSPLGVYIFHGDSDRVVSVDYARQMKNVLAGFHSDFSYYEYPGGSHWFGDHSVDWDPLFDFFRWHKRPVDSMVNQIDFVTYNPGISASFRWAGIIQQEEPLKMSRIKFDRSLSQKVIKGTTENVHVLRLSLNEFPSGSAVLLNIDSAALRYSTKTNNDSIYLKKQNGTWALSTAPEKSQKGPHRNGTLKDGFNHNMVFVYGTTGNAEENRWSFNKARYDAESWYYRGNGAVPVIADKEFDPLKYKDRGVVLFGNQNSNSAWNVLLKNSPIQVSRKRAVVGSKTFEGGNIGAYFVWPRQDSDVASVAVISGTGIEGMNAASANQYFAGASGFPDYMIFGSEMLTEGVDGVKEAGFFDNDWKVSK